MIFGFILSGTMAAATCTSGASLQHNLDHHSKDGLAGQALRLAGRPGL